ncbi:hypothetical protein HaLaN_02869 [Haematococcus lacustris]|uniref:Uncharacterized protein n=1 Tax=Haematococcus lacustris TaxID=44745 RepID=A0A699YD15_HAELA|nr:hypothetical protein HaLaN_02869 [Haematococcus lacustris]
MRRYGSAVLATRNSQMKRLKAIESGELRDGVLPLGITYDALTRANDRELSAMFKRVVEQMGSQLLSASQVSWPTGSSAGQQHAAAGTATVPATADSQWSPAFVQFMHGQAEAFKLALLIRPDLTLLSGRNASELDGKGYESASLAAPHVWTDAVQQVNLSPGQARSCWVLAQLYSQWCRRLMVQRAQLTQQMAQLLSLPRYGQMGSDPLFNSRLDVTLSEAELVSKLNANVAKERCGD